MDGRVEAPLPWVVPFRLMRVVVPAVRSRTKTSRLALVSPATRLVAWEEKLTKRPFPEIAGSKQLLFGSTPAVESETRSMAPVSRSLT